MKPWYVITGGPCSGKTTLIRELERRGEFVVHEYAADVIKGMQREGLNPAVDFEELQRRCYAHQSEVEAPLPPTRLFLDRSVLEVAAYYRVRGLAVPSELEEMLAPRYAKVFLLELLPYERDGVRYERDAAEARRVHEEIERIYRESGHRVVHVPVLPVPERAELVLQACSGSGT